MNEMSVKVLTLCLFVHDQIILLLDKLIFSLLAQMDKLKFTITIVTKMNDGVNMIWASIFSSGHVKYGFTHPDGHVEVNSFRYTLNVRETRHGCCKNLLSESKNLPSKVGI